MDALRKPMCVIPAVLLVAAVSCLYVFMATYKPDVRAFPTMHFEEDDSLERTLERAAMPDKVVILMPSNEVWSAPNSITDMFLDTMRKGNGTRKYINHLVIVAVDRQAYDRCKVVHRHCYELNGNSSTHEEALYMTPTYLDLIWKRIAFLLQVLELGYSFVSTDADIMWLQDPFPHFFSDADMVVSSDRFRGRPDDMSSSSNVGFYMTRSNRRTIEFFKYFIACRSRYPGSKEQDVFDIIKNDANATRIGVRIKFQDTLYFGGFCEPSRNFNLVCTMHANCCVGLKNKIKDLKLVLQDWFNFRNLPPSQKANFTAFKFRSPHYCRSP